MDFKTTLVYKDLNVEQINLIEFCNKTFDYSTPLNVKKLSLIEYSEEKVKIIGSLYLKISLMLITNKNIRITSFKEFWYNYINQFIF